MDNYKIPPFNKNDINERVQKFRNILKLDKEIECKLLSKRTILIKQLQKN